jgi:ABC-type nitrate/sulfonate/bicarbonate transport system ATPase subunit
VTLGAHLDGASVERSREGQSVQVLHDVSLRLRPGKVTVLFGANGSGKSTLAMTVASLLKPTQGSVSYLGDNGQQSEDARIAFIPQNYRVSNFPWLRVRQNAALFADRPDSAGGTLNVGDLLSEFLPELTGSERTYELSGGQQQIVALCRSLAVPGSLLIADEALSALDVARHLSVLDALGRLLPQRSAPTLWISHNLDEGIYLADEIVLLSAKSKTIVANHAVDRSGTRSIDDLTSGKHATLRAMVLDFLMAESGGKRDS